MKRPILVLLTCLLLFSSAFASGDDKKDGWDLFRKRDYSAALKRFEVDLNKYREWAELRDAMGWCHYFLGEYADAEQRFREALEIQSDYKWSLEGLDALAAVRRAPLEEAEGLLAAGQYQEARARFERISDGKTVADNDNAGLALRGEAWCLYYLGQYEEAVKVFRNARKKLGKDAQALRGIAYCQFALEDYRPALTSISLALEQEPADYTARLTAGWCHYWMKQYGKADDEFQRALAASSSPWAAFAGIAWCKYRDGDTAGALQAFERGLEFSPYVAGDELEALIEARADWRPLRNAIGWAALREDLSSWAITQFQTSERLDCEQEQAVAGQAFALFRMSRYDEALAKARSLSDSPEYGAPRTFRTALPDGATASVTFNVASLEGWIAQRQGRHDDALARFREVRRLHPDWPDPACGEGWALYAQGNYPAAEQAFDAALELLPGYSDANSGREAVRAWRYGTYDGGWTLYYAGDFAGAQRAFQSILDDSRDPFPRAQLDLVNASIGWAQFRSGMQAAAEASFERALNAQPEQGLAHKGAGYLELDREDWKKAARHFAAAVQSPDFATDAETWTVLGRAHLELRHQKLAGEALDKAVELGPELALAHAWKGVALRARGDLVEARISLERAIALDPDVARIEAVRDLIENHQDFYRLHSPLGWAHFYRGDYAAAADEFRDSIAKDPLETSSPRGLGLSLLRSGDTSGGAKELKGWLKTAPKKEADWGPWSSTLSELGWSLYAAGDYRDALKVFKQLDDLHSGEDLEFAEPHDALGWCYLRLNKKRDAKRAFLEAIAIDPRHDNSISGLEALKGAR